MQTVWVLGDQLNTAIASLEHATPDDARVLMVESQTKRASKRWHRQRLHVVLASMRRFARELTDAGWQVDYRHSPTLADGLAAHRDEHSPRRVVAMEPMSWHGQEMLDDNDVATVANNQFLCHPDEFAGWADGRKALKMEDFYRWQRTRLDILIDDGEPAGGRWNFDHDNREPPPDDGRSWPEITRFDHDDIDRDILTEMAAPTGEASTQLWGAQPSGWWPTSRAQALTRLDEFIRDALPRFGTHEDAMLRDQWKLAHSVLASSLNLGLLHPGEVAEAAEVAFRNGDAPINAAEGFIRQVIGWREYVWGVYWLWMPTYQHRNELDATRPLPPLFRGATAAELDSDEPVGAAQPRGREATGGVDTDDPHGPHGSPAQPLRLDFGADDGHRTDGNRADTDMACVRGVLDHLHDYGWTHHIERLMVLGNLFLTAGVRPSEVVDWMWASFVDGAEWVMLPNVVGMALHADGGMMATKPYASGGAYINRMSDYCGGCRFDPKKRTGPDACPYTSLYWDFLARNHAKLDGNHRLGNQFATMKRLKDLPETRARAAEVLRALDEGRL